MAYKMYLDGVLMPVTPSKVQVKVGSQNNSLTLISGEEINVLKSPGLSTVSFELLLPQVSYPFSFSERQSADYYLSLFERLKTGKAPFQWILNRARPDGTSLFSSNLTVSLEDYQITDSAENGFDLSVQVSLKQYRKYSTKTVTLQTGTDTATVSSATRETSGAPAAATYTVKSGDCLWNIAKKYLGNGSRYTEIYSLNKDKIKNPNLIYPGQVLTLPS
jgi:LysM repeat protein